jgi:branched-chain amino acid transport system substrate-binding protein
MKKTIFTISAVTVILVFTIVSYKVQPESVRVGMLLPLSGPAAYYGEQSKNGAEVALGELRILYPKLNLHLDYQDTMFTSKGGLEAYKMLSSIGKPKAIITASSQVSNAVKPKAKKDGVLQMAIFAGTPAYSSPDDLSFRTSTRSEVEANYIASYIEQNYSKVVVLTASNFEGAVATSDALLNTLRMQGSIDVIEEKFDSTNTDHRQVLLKIKSEKPDAIFVSALAKDIGVVANQARSLEIDSQFLAIRTAEDPSIFTVSKSAVNGLLYSYPFDAHASSTLVKEFSDTFYKKFNKYPDAYAAEAYLATKIVGEVYNYCGNSATTECVKRYMETKFDGRDTVFGKIKFDENGDILYPFFMKKIVDGNFTNL